MEDACSDQCSACVSGVDSVIVGVGKSGSQSSEWRMYVNDRPADECVIGV
jgi:hypothetical protein